MNEFEVKHTNRLAKVLSSVLYVVIILSTGFMLGSIYCTKDTLSFNRLHELNVSVPDAQYEIYRKYRDGATIEMSLPKFIGDNNATVQ